MKVICAGELALAFLALIIIGDPALAFRTLAFASRSCRRVVVVQRNNNDRAGSRSGVSGCISCTDDNVIEPCCNDIIVSFFFLANEAAAYAILAASVLQDV